MPINRLLVSMSVPIMISMLVQALYNIVDSMFVAQLNENALTAVSLAFPAQNLMIAVATGTGVGINALLSKSLGEKNFQKVNQVADHAIFLAFCSYAVFAVLGLAFSRTFFTLQTQDPQIVQYGTEYLQICTLFSFGLFFQITFERVAGAAAATVFGQIVAAVLGAVINHKKNHEVQLSLRSFRFNGHIVKSIYGVGVPSIIMSSIGSVMTFGMNKILIAFSTTATAVFGVYFKLQSFVFMPIFGMNNGMVPIVAYNYGARKPDRMIKTVKLSICYATGIMVIGFVVFQLFTGPLLRIFNASDHMLAIGIPALRTISFSFLLAGFCVISSSLFQALSHGVLSLIVSLVRQLVILLPLAYLLSLTGNLNLIWLAFPCAELVSCALCALFIRYVYRKQIKPLEQPLP